jgi:hypothetical protein
VNECSILGVSGAVYYVNRLGCVYGVDVIDDVVMICDGRIVVLNCGWSQYFLWIRGTYDLGVGDLIWYDWNMLVHVGFVGTVRCCVRGYVS